jgi:transposase InsO family protein
LNSYAERFVLSIKSECLNHVVPLGEGHLRTLVNEYVAHYHFERPHQSLGNELLIARERRVARGGAVRRRQRLGGMLNYYERAAA